MHTINLKRAPHSLFRILRPQILFGHALAEVKQIERSIAQFGLMMPIVVSKSQNQLVVIDGKKRLAAIRRMIFAGTLPRSLHAIPYIFVKEAKNTDFHAASVLSAYDIYDAVMSLKSKGFDLDDIADKLYLCRRSVIDIMSLSRLCTPIRKAFFNNTLSFQQARLYAAMPDEDEQIAVLTALGPFAEPEAIIKAIRQGEFETVCEQFALPENNVVTIPKSVQNYVWEQAA